MHRSLLYFIIAFTVGIFFRTFVEFGQEFTLFLFCIPLVLLALALYEKRSGNPRTRQVVVVALIGFAFAAGVFRYDIADLSHGDQYIDQIRGEEVRAQVLVVDEPDIRATHTKLTVQITSLDHGNGYVPVDARALIIVDHYPRYLYGDTLLLSGKIESPQNFSNDDGRLFDYVSYLGKDDIYYQMYRPEIVGLASGGGNPIKRSLLLVKSGFMERVGRLMPEPHVSLLGGLLVGAKQAMGEDLLEDFRRTGIIHIVVLSGYNVTIVADAIMRVFAFLPRFMGFGLGVLSIVGFAILTGASATVVRASIMALIVIVAKVIGRTYVIGIALMLAAFLMLMHNPKILVYDPSFQLSFIATLGLIYLAPSLERVFHFLPSKLQLREFAMATIATQIFVLPLLLYQVGQLSLVAVPVNLLVLIVVPLTMLFGFIAGVMSLAGALFAIPFAYIAYALLAYILFVVEVFSGLTFASVNVHAFPFVYVVAVYMLYGAVLFKYRKALMKPADPGSGRVIHHTNDF